MTGGVLPALDLLTELTGFHVRRRMDEVRERGLADTARSGKDGGLSAQYLHDLRQTVLVPGADFEHRIARLTVDLRDHLRMLRMDLRDGLRPRLFLLPGIALLRHRLVFLCRILAGLHEVHLIKKDHHRDLPLFHMDEEAVEQVQIRIRMAECEDDDRLIDICNRRPDQLIFPWQDTDDGALSLLL